MKKEKRNIYYHQVYRRHALFKGVLLGLFIAIGSWPRLFCECWVRKSMGERAFSMSTCVFIALLIGFIPYLKENFQSMMSPWGGGGLALWKVIIRYPSWYMVIAGFLYFAYQRHKEIKREPGVFDFAKFSLSPGIIDERFYKISILGQVPTPKQVATLLEPALFLAAGIALAILQQPIGYVIIICGIIYSGSYFAAHAIGDDFIMDKIDEMICTEELMNTLTYTEQADTRGFSPYGSFPGNPDLRRKVVEKMVEDEALQVY